MPGKPPDSTAMLAFICSLDKSWTAFWTTTLLKTRNISLEQHWKCKNTEKSHEMRNLVGYVCLTLQSSSTLYTRISCTATLPHYYDKSACFPYGKPGNTIRSRLAGCIVCYFSQSSRRHVGCWITKACGISTVLYPCKGCWQIGGMERAAITEFQPLASS